MLAGFKTRFYHISLDGTNTNVAEVSPGAKTSLVVAGRANDKSTSSCDGCVTQFYVRGNQTAGVDVLECLGSSTDGWDFYKKISFTAPTAPGTYNFDLTESWQYSCVTDTTLINEAPGQRPRRTPSLTSIHNSSRTHACPPSRSRHR